MRDPASTADGQTYEREAITRWFDEGRLSSPVTGLPLTSRTFTTNFALKSAIASFMEERPQIEAQARQLTDLQACAERCERELRSARAKASTSVPRNEYERVLRRLRLSEAAVAGTVPSSAVTSDARSPIAEPETKKCQTLVVEFLADLHKQKASAEDLRLSKASELDAIAGDVARIEAQAASEDLQAKVLFAKASALEELLHAKLSGQEATVRELKSQAESLGIDISATMEQIRSDPAAPQKNGSLLYAFAKFHCECIVLRTKQEHVYSKAITAEKAAEDYRAAAESLAVKKSTLTDEIAALDAQVNLLTQAANCAGDDDGIKLAAAATWALHASHGMLVPVSGNLLLLLDLNEQHLAVESAALSSAIKEFRANGCAAGDLNRMLGISVAALKESGFSAGELRQDGFILGQIKEVDFTALQLKDCFFNLFRIVPAGLSGMRQLVHIALNRLAWPEVSPLSSDIAYLGQESVHADSKNGTETFRPK